MFKRKMFKHALSKRALPIILSVAMAFQSMPATALAAEEAVLNDNTQTDSSGEETGNTSEADAETSVEASETADEGDFPVSAEQTSSEGESAQKEDSSAVHTSSAEEETEVYDTKVFETEVLAEDAAEDETPSRSEENETLVAKIIVDDKKVDAYAKNSSNGFTRILGEKGIAFFTEYAQQSKCSGFQQAIGDWLSIEVDGEEVNTLKDRLTYNWVKKAGSGEETDTPLGDAFPEDAGVYELTISMDLSDVNGLCDKLENDLKVLLTIERADIELRFEKSVLPGKTAGDLIDEINKNYTVQYKNGNYSVSREILAIRDAEGKDDPDKKLPLHVFVIDEYGERQPLVTTEKFDRNKDYVLTIDDIALTENAAGNYKLSVEESYIIKVGSLQETVVRYELKDSGKDLIEVYNPSKTWTTDEVAKDLFAEAVTDEPGTVTKGSGAPTVFIQGTDGDYDTVLEGAVPAAKWYTRIRLNTGASYKVDEEAGEIKDTKNNVTYIYKPMDSEPVDSGEYFIIWSYAGDDSVYEKSHSEAVRFTIDPAPVVIQISAESVEDANFRDGMDDDAVRKALAKVSYGVYPLVKNETTGIMEAGATAIETTPDFFGTSYRGDSGESQMTQYYVPEFILQRRLCRMTEKGEAAVDIDSRSVDWEEVTDGIKVVVDKEAELRALKLPNNVSAENLESAEYEFRIFFTGQKVIYDNDGKIAGETGSRISITDATTNAANRNYLADITDRTLDDTAVPVPVEGMRTESVQIVTDGIVDAFITDNRDMLDPQLDSGVTGEAARAIHQGTLENPAVKIYDQNALFTDRASYKQAKVHKSGANGEIGEALSVLSTDESLGYTWSYATLESYEAYLEKWDEVQRQYKDFEDYNDKNIGELGWTDAADGTLDSFKNAGLYRLTVSYNDPDYIYQSARADVYFKVERQEIIIVPGEQFVKDGDSIADIKEKIGKVNNEDFTIYKLPHNSIDEYNALTDEAKKGYTLPADEEIAGYEEEHGKKPDLTLDSLTWEILRKVKDPESGLDKEPAEWIEADGKTFDEDFTYGVAAHWTGSIDWLSGGDYNDNSNYTTRDVKTFKVTGEDRHHESVGVVRFYDRQIYVEIDTEKIKALGHEYNGEPVDLKEAAKALSFYTDEALTESSRLSTDAIINTADEYDPAKINIYWEKNGYTYANKNAVYGGTYTLKLRFEGGGLNTAQGSAESSTYAPLNGTGWWDGDKETASFTVSPREITVTPKILPAEILAAGETADTLLTEGIDVQGIVGNDQKFFDYAEIAAGSFDVCRDGKNEDGTDREKPAYVYNIDKKGGYPAFNKAASYVIQVDGREIKEPGNEYLRFNSTYTVKLTNELATPLKESYNVVYGTAEVMIENRGSADITAISSTNTLSAKGINYDFRDSTYTIRPRGAVKFYYDTDTGVTVVGKDGTETLKNTNILGFRIYAPKEFMNDFSAGKEKFIYKNTIWNAGGYFSGSAEWNNAGYITVVFPLAKEDTEKSFNITWEDGYTETFTLADIVLEEDFTKAVAPKSIAFNGVSGKMAVGETQQLNLKITKAQLGDVINIRYRIKGGETKNEYISLDPETGLVTALKAGKTATIVEAYPVYKNAKGDFVPVLDNKGKQAKAASTKITVTEVTASSVKKITAQGDSAKLYFTVPDNGYRREIYVVDVTKGTAYADRKKWKAADFNKAIDDMKNAGWENAGFAVQPIYSYAVNNNLDTKVVNNEYDKKLKAHILTIRGLEAEHEYAVYVRNVSAARALDDGSVVTLSASGAVKSFKTTKPQVQELELDFTVKTSENDKKNVVTHPVNEDGTIVVDEYTVELSAKSAQLNVYGYFSDKAGGNDAAEDKDQRRYSLVPILKEEKAVLKNYLLPKLVYAVYDAPEEEPFQPGLQQSKYATISNKGKITLKGVDLNGEKAVYIYVRDSFQHVDDYDSDAMIALTITAKPAAVTGKSVKMKVGQTVKLSDYLEYKDAKKKIPYYRSCGVAITKEMIAEAEASGYRIEDMGSSKLEHDWRITAVSPNKAKFNLKVTDYDADGNLMETAVVLTSTQIDAVKRLKVTYVDDRYITVNFTHPANSNDADNGSVYDYAFEVKDARGNVVDKIVLSKPHLVSDIGGVDAKELKNALSWIQYTGTKVDNSNPKSKKIMVSGNRGFNYYTGTTAKTRTFAYTYYNEKLIRLSSYTISVTPLYGNQKAEKAATVKTKTTNIPASYHNVDLTGAIPDRLGGYTIRTLAKQQYKGDTTKNNENQPIDVPYRFVSGGIYTLSLGTYITSTKERCSDTLTWKSSNTKVATVKANPGTYDATFKTLNQGTTTITLTSKITKKVIVRYQVKVYAVKDGSSYAGDYEPTWTSGFYEKILALYDPYYEGRLEVLSENVPLVIDNGDDGKDIETWVSFTAPHYGQYKFTGLGSTTFYDSKDGEKIGTGSSFFLEANQKVYFRVTGNGTLTVTGTELARLTKAHTKESPLEVKKGFVSFTAWEDNVYTFYLNGISKNTAGMKAGETKFIEVSNDGKMYVTCREEVAAEELKLGSHPTGTVEIDKDNQVRYISFTANTAGEYTFTYQEVAGVEVNFSTATGGKPLEVYTEPTNAERETVRRFKLEAGEKLVVELKADPEITNAEKKFSVSVTVSAEPRRRIEDSTITVPKGTKEIVEYVIPEFTTEKAQFRFKVTGEEGTVIEEYYNKDYDEISTGLLKDDVLTISKTSGIKAGDSIYIKVTAGEGAAGNSDAKDAVLTVTQVAIVPLTNMVSTEIDNDTEQWYTFTAAQDGYYEFGVIVDERAENDETPTHNASIDICNELFGRSIAGANGIKTRIIPMKTGERIAIRLNPGYVSDITKDDGTTETVKSNVTVSVNLLDIQPLVLGEEKAVEIPVNSKEVRYYSFTAAVRDDYTISWKAADSKTDNAKVTYLPSIVDTGTEINSITKNLDVGTVCYIKVEIDDTASENPVNGTLSVKAANLSAYALTDGTAYPFRLADQDEKVVKFTAAESGSYSIVTTVDENATNGLPYVYPTIKCLNDSQTLAVPEASISFKKGETKYFKLSFDAGESEVRETAGTITIRFSTEPFEGGQMDVSVPFGITKEYTYTIPESGRYEFKADYETGKAEIYRSVDNGDVLVDGNYYLKNTKIIIDVTGADENADASVKLYKPALINTIPLNAGGTKIEVPAGETRYYELSVSQPVNCRFDISDIAEGKTAVQMNYVMNNESPVSWPVLSDGGSLSMAKNDNLIIKMKSFSAAKDASCVLNITANTELNLGDNTVHLEAGESVNLTYRAKEAGYYSFSVNQPGARLVFKAGINSAQIGERFYDIAKLSAKGTRSYALTNEGSSSVDITVTMKTVEPVVLEPGSRSEEISIAAGEWAHFALRTFQKAGYSIKITDTSKGADLNVELDGRNVTGSLKKIADGVYIEKTLNGEVLLRIQNNGVEETKAAVELTMSEAQPLTGEPITIGKNESRLISFVATADGRYLITKDNENITMTLVSSLSDCTGEINGSIDAYEEVILNKGDKLVCKLSYEPAETDKNPASEQTVNVTIAPIQPINIEAESTTVTLAEKDNLSVWYQFNASGDGTYTFALEDSYSNDVTNEHTFAFHEYMNKSDKDTGTERYMRAGTTVFVNVKYAAAGTYALKYTMMKAMTEPGIEVLSFKYVDEQQKIKFVVPCDGIYRISANAIRGSFTVGGTVGTKRVFSTFSENRSSETSFLKKNDIVTITVTAKSSGKSYVSLLIEEVCMAETLTLGKEERGVSGAVYKYYSFYAAEKGLYVITVGGESKTSYLKDDSRWTIESDNTKYVELDAGERIIVRILRTKTGGKQYVVKAEKVDIVSLDGQNTKENPFTVSAVESIYFGFSTEKAYIQYTIPEDGNYYRTVEPVDESAYFRDEEGNTLKGQYGTHKYKKDEVITYEFVNKRPKNEEGTSANYEEALVKFTIKKRVDAKDNVIGVDDTRQGTLKCYEVTTFLFKAPEDGTYIVNHNCSNCIIDNDFDGTWQKLKKDETIELKLFNESSVLGCYELTITKVTPTALPLGVTAEGVLERGSISCYEFDSTETDDDGETTYQVYISGTDIAYDYSIADADGNELSSESGQTGNKEYSLKKGAKLAFMVTNNSTDKTRPFSLTVKKVDYIPLNVDESVSGTLDTYEKAYYEFVSADESTSGTKYQVSLDSKGDMDIQDVKVARLTKDEDGSSKLGDPEDASLSNGIITLEKGEKLLFTVANGDKPAQFNLTVKNAEEPAASYEPVALDETKTGKLTADGKAYYEFAVDDAAEDGTLYSVYFSGTACTYSRTTVTTGEQIFSGQLVSGSNEFTWKKGDKVRFTVSGTAIYKLIVKKVVYTPLTLGATVTKTLNAKEAAYYQFTSQDEPAEGGTTTRYQVYGTTDYTVEKVTVNEDNTTSISPVSRASEYELKKGESLRFKLKNNSVVSTFKLTIDKAVYRPLALGVPVEGRLSDGAYVYYQFTSQDEPAEGEATTKYQIYGTAEYEAKRVTVNEDKTTGTELLGWDVRECELAKGQILQLKVTGPDDSADGYNLTVAKYEEKPVTVGNKIETGSLGKGQQVVYAFKYEGESQSAYTLSYKQPKGVTITVFQNDSELGVQDQQRIIMSKGDILMISIKASYEADSFEFTLSEFKPETLTLGTMTDLKKLSANETVYYQYTVQEAGNYVVSIMESSDGLPLWYTVTKADGTVRSDTISGGIGELKELEKDDILTLKVSAPAKIYSFRLLLQKAVSDETMTALPWNGSLQPGEVKHFKFTIPEAEKEDTPEYIVTITGSSDKLGYWYDDNEITASVAEPYSDETSGDFVLKVANTSMYSAAECKIEVQKKEAPLNLGSYTGKLEPNGYRYFTFPGNTIQVTDAETDAAAEDFVPYYYLTSGENQCTIERKNDKNQWESIAIGMSNDLSDYVVRVRNTDSENTLNFAFELRDAWRDEITADTRKEYRLEADETAYFTVTAPEDKALYVSVSSANQLKVSYGAVKNSISESLNMETSYGVGAGKTCYFKVVNSSNASRSFTLNVTQTNMIPLQLNTMTTTYIPSGGNALYEFEAPDAGDYIVIVDGTIENADHQYKVGDGTEDETFENGQVFKLEANEMLSLSIENHASSQDNCSCKVQIVKITTIELGGPTELHFETYGDVYCLAVPVAEAGEYIINGQVSITSSADFYVDCLNDNLSATNIYYYNSNSSNKNLPAVQMEADETIYIKVWPYYVDSYSPAEQYGQNITITVTQTPTSTDS